MNLKSLNGLLKNKYLPYLSVAILGVVTLYSTWYANYYLSANSDDIVDPYLFKHFRLHDILLPGQHSNILKFPLFILQALIPYNFATFTVANLVLGLIAILGWALLLMWVFGKKYTLIICLALISILLGSQLFNYDIIGTTIRNIEYPIVLLFVVACGKLLEKIKLSRKTQIIGVLIGLLYSLTLVGDSFFLYTMSISVFAVLAIYWFFNDKPALNKNFKYAFGYFVGFTLLAGIIRVLIEKIGIVILYNASVFKPQVLPLSHLAPSISIATVQLLNLFDANIFGQVVVKTNNLVFLNFGLLVLGLIGLIAALRDTLLTPLRKYLIAKIRIGRVFTIGVMALTFFVSFVLYIGSGLVVVQSPSGAISTAYQERYITIMPLILVAGIVYLLWRKFDSRRLVTWGLPILIFVVLLINISPIKDSHTYIGSTRQSIIDVANKAEQNHVPLLITGYWYGASTEFWSHGKTQFAVVASCNIPAPPFNNRISWYTPSSSVHKSALVIVHQGQDASYWNCTNSQLLQIYGQPSKIIPIKAANSPTLWIYNYDLRTKLATFVY